VDNIEILAVLLGFINIVLIVRRSLWNYPFGIAMVALSFFMFIETKLYSDALLQIFFLALNIYGWLNWNSAATGTGLPVRWQGAKPFLLWGVIGLAASLGWGFLMQRYTDAAYPYWDASIAMLSVLAQLLMARRFIDNWTWWIIVDCLAIPLYWIKGLSLYAGLYGVFLIVSIVGLIRWMRSQRRAAE
jgi:nicotinamide mononucleotide transporter